MARRDCRRELRPRFHSGHLPPWYVAPGLQRGPEAGCAGAEQVKQPRARRAFRCELRRRLLEKSGRPLRTRCARPRRGRPLTPASLRRRRPPARRVGLAIIPRASHARARSGKLKCGLVERAPPLGTPWTGRVSPRRGDDLGWVTAARKLLTASSRRVCPAASDDGTRPAAAPEPPRLGASFRCCAWASVPITSLEATGGRLLRVPARSCPAAQAACVDG